MKMLPTHIFKTVLLVPFAGITGVPGSDSREKMEQIMRNHGGETLKVRRKPFLATAVIVVLALPVVAGALSAPWLRPQALAGQSSATRWPAVPQWQIDAGGKIEFDVASVKQNKSDDPANSNVALGPGNYYSPTGGLFSATNIPLYAYIIFAYKATANQTLDLHTQVPEWVLSDRFDIQARVNGSPTKDQMRLMMQALLADRFKLAIHNETRQLPVFALVLSKPGKTGLQLQIHSNDIPCSTDPLLPPPSGSASAPSATVAGGFPTLCGGIQPMQPSAPGRVRMGGRNVTMGLIASTLAVMPDGPDRPVLDQTGLSGTFDFTLECVRQPTGASPPGVDAQADASAPTFLEALKEQLGLKLESQTGPVDILVLDYVEEPSAN